MRGRGASAGGAWGRTTASSGRRAGGLWVRAAAASAISRPSAAPRPIPPAWPRRQGVHAGDAGPRRRARVGRLAQRGLEPGAVDVQRRSIRRQLVRRGGGGRGRGQARAPIRAAAPGAPAMLGGFPRPDRCLLGPPAAAPGRGGASRRATAAAPPAPPRPSALGYDDLSVVDPTAGEAKDHQGASISEVRRSGGGGRAAAGRRRFLASSRLDPCCCVPWCRAARMGQLRWLQVAAQRRPAAGCRCPPLPGRPTAANRPPPLARCRS